MGNVFIGMSFFKKLSVPLDLASNIVKFPDITLQLRTVNGKIQKQIAGIENHSKDTAFIRPNRHVFVPVVIERNLGHMTDTVDGLPACGRRSHLMVISG